MSDIIEENITTEARASADRSLEWSSLLLPVMVAVVAMFARTFLAGESFLGRAESLENWSCFGQSILRDVLLATAVVSICIVVSVFVPQVGLFVERVVLRSKRRWFLVAIVFIGLATSAAVSRFILGGLPHIQDEVAMVFQAKVLAGGGLYADTPPLPEFFDHEYVLFDGPRWYGKYFLGPSLAMVPGVWLGLVWLVNPLLGALTILLTYFLGRELLGEKVARVAALLMAVSPFRMSLFGMMMAHPVCMASLALAAVAVVKVVKDPRRWGWAMLAGAGLGYAVNSRPFTAVLLGGVMGICAMMAFPWRQLRWQTVIAFVIPFVLFAGIYLGYNKALTGEARLSPFTKWCPKDRLGFGPDIGQEYWPDKDRGNTLAKALFHNTYFCLDAVAANLAGFGSPALVLMLLAPAVCTRRGVGWALGAAVLAVMVGYLFYFTPSVFAGQARYWSEAMPAMLLLVAVGLAFIRRGVPKLCRLCGIAPAVRTGRAACWLALAALLVYGVPKAYGAILSELDASLWTRATRIRHLVDANGIENAVIFIRAKHYRDSKTDARWDTYGDGFGSNSPDLRGSVVYARDLGPTKNAELLKLYPGRRAYHVDPYASDDFEIVPLEAATTCPTHPDAGRPER